MFFCFFLSFLVGENKKKQPPVPKKYVQKNKQAEGTHDEEQTSSHCNAWFSCYEGQKNKKKKRLWQKKIK